MKVNLFLWHQTASVRVFGLLSLHLSLYGNDCIEKLSHLVDRTLNPAVPRKVIGCKTVVGKWESQIGCHSYLYLHMQSAEHMQRDIYATPAELLLLIK